MGDYSRNHIVTRGYLDLFGVERMVAAHPVSSGSPAVISTKDAAVRREFYTYRRDDGTRSTFAEEAMGPLENRAVPVMRTIDERWPLTVDERATLAEYLALQVVRGPAWRSFHDDLRDHVIDEQSAENLTDLGPESLDKHIAMVRSDAYRVVAMFRQVPKIGSLLASMQWILVSFGSDRLLTSDQPVVVVERDRSADGMLHGGIANAAEFRFPLSPRHALLLAWADKDDARLHGSPQHARIINHSVKDQADVHWFCPPTASPSHGFGDLTPLTFGLIDGYDWSALERSRRRQRILGEVSRWIETQEPVREISVVTAPRW